MNLDVCGALDCATVVKKNKKIKIINKNKIKNLSVLLDQVQ